MKKVTELLCFGRWLLSHPLARYTPWKAQRELCNVTVFLCPNALEIHLWMSATGAVFYVMRSAMVRRRASIWAELARALKGALCEKHPEWGRTGCGALGKDHSKCHQRLGSQRQNIFTMAEISTATHFEPSKEIPEVVKGSNYSISFVSVIYGYLTKKAVAFFPWATSWHFGIRTVFSKSLAWTRGQQFRRSLARRVLVFATALLEMHRASEGQKSWKLCR